LVLNKLSAMKAVTLNEAKLKLGALLNAAERGEHVMIKRNGKRAVALIPVSGKTSEAWPEIPATALGIFAQELAAERTKGGLLLLGETAREAAAALRG